MCEFHGSNSNGFGDIWWTDNPIYFSSKDCYSVFRKVANIHSFGALVTIQWGISDRLSISDQINKNSHFITKHVVTKLQYNNYIVMQGLSETCR